MARQRFNHLSRQRQEVVLAAAGTEFAEHGYAAASTNRIIERADSSKGELYYYFENKADLLATVVEEAVARAMVEMDLPALEELDAATFWDRVRDMTRGSLRLMELDTWYMRVLRSLYRLRDEPAARAATAGLMDRARDLVAAFIQRGRDLGVVRADLPLELLVEMHLAADEAGDRWMMKRWNELTERERVALIDARVDVVRDMLDASHMGWGR
jgi:AcrR family transcriptional regulator